MGKHVSLAVGLLAIWVVISTQSPVWAQAGPTETGPAVGSKIPPFKARDQFGREQNLDSLAGQNGLVLLFVRSADWCPFCKEQLVQLQKAQDRFRQKGLNLAAISYDTTQIFKVFANRYNITYSLLADPKSEIIRQFGLQDQSKINPILHGRVKPGYAQAGFIVLDRQGVVKEKYFGNDFYDRYTANNVIAKLFPELLEGAAQPVSDAHMQVLVKQSDRDVIAGNRVTLGVDIALPQGMYIYASGQTTYQPVQLVIDSVGGSREGARYLGVANYPEPKIKLLPVIKEQVPTYEGHFSISQDLIISLPDYLRPMINDPSFQTDPLDLIVRGRLKYQACDANVCYPPAEIDLTWNFVLHSLDWERVEESPLKDQD